MSARIEWTVRATRQLLKLERTTQRRIRDAVGGLANFPAVANMTRLVNHDPLYRLRVGNYRVLFSFDGAVRVITIEQVRKRDETTY